MSATSSSTASQPLRVLIIGAHPDDCDVMAGGTAALWRRAGHTVKLVSVTNGESGHHLRRGAELVALRTAEARAAGALIGSEYQVLAFRDGRLEPTFEARCEIIRLIREFHPDLILTHRPNDYHPDHRYVSQLVCDAAYMVTVPPIVPDVPVLRDNPAIAYCADRFQRPYPFAARVVVDIEPVLDTVVDMLDCHRSQFYEWLPWNQQVEDQVPAGPVERREWLKQWYLGRIAWLADQFRDLCQAQYGPARAADIRWIEAFEPCEYGRPWDAALFQRLFPMAVRSAK